MAFPRAMVMDAGLQRPGRVGDGMVSHLNDAIQALDSNQVVLAASIVGGLYDRAGMTAGRTDTTDTAVAILAAMPQMDIGDTFLLMVSVQVAFAITWAAGVGVTLAGKATAPASSITFVLITKNTAATLTWKQL